MKFRQRVQRYISIKDYTGSRAEAEVADAVFDYANAVVQLASQLAPVSNINRLHLYETGKARAGTKRVIISFGEQLPDQRAFYMEREYKYIARAIEEITARTYFEQLPSGKQKFKKVRDAVASIIIPKRGTE